MAPTEKHLSLSDPRSVAEAGEKIYKEKLREKFEKTHAGQFVAIDVLNEESYIALTPDGALEKARSGSPHGIFHLIKIGSTGAFSVSHSSDARPDWVFR